MPLPPMIMMTAEYEENIACSGPPIWRMRLAVDRSPSELVTVWAFDQNMNSSMGNASTRFERARGLGHIK